MNTYSAHELAQQVILLNNGRKNGTQLIFRSSSNPYFINAITRGTYAMCQVFMPKNIEVVDFILNMFKNTTPSEHNFIDRDWTPGLADPDVFKMCPETERKLRNSEYIRFDSLCFGEFTIHFRKHLPMPVLEIYWSESEYINDIDDDGTITGETEVAIFYQMLKLYKQVVSTL